MDLLNSRDVANEFGVSIQTARRWLRLNIFDSQIIWSVGKNRTRLRTTKRAVLVYKKKNGHTLNAAEIKYLESLNFDPKEVRTYGSPESVYALEANTPVR